jgi:hypothetical protein
MRTQPGKHVCVRQAICFQCFQAGLERTRARRQAWAQRALPFEAPITRLTPREVAHRRQMLEHLSNTARRA